MTAKSFLCSRADCCSAMPTTLQLVQDTDFCHWSSINQLQSLPCIRSMDSDILRSASSFVPRPRPSGDYSESIMVQTLPLIGRVHIVNDRDGMIQISFVLLYWVYGTFCTLYIILLPQYNDGRIPSSVVISKYGWNKIHGTLIWPLTQCKWPTCWTSNCCVKIKFLCNINSFFKVFL